MCVIYSYGIFYLLTSRIKSSKFLSPMKQIPILWKHTAVSSSYVTSTFTQLRFVLVLSSHVTLSFVHTCHSFSAGRGAVGLWTLGIKPRTSIFSPEPSVWFRIVLCLYRLLCQCLWFLMFLRSIYLNSWSFVNKRKDYPLLIMDINGFIMSTLVHLHLHYFLIITVAKHTV